MLYKYSRQWPRWNDYADKSSGAKRDNKLKGKTSFVDGTTKR